MVIFIITEIIHFIKQLEEMCNEKFGGRGKLDPEEAEKYETCLFFASGGWK